MITATLHQGLWRVMLIFCCAFAVAAADKSGVTPNTVSLPKGPGAIEGLGESFQPALNTGTASYGLTIKVPPGTRGFAPALRLQYEGGGGNGPLGFGWQLSIPCIQRRSDNGIPTYGQHMGFPRQDAFMNDAREDLVPLTNGFWFCKNEAAFIRYRPVGNHWEGVRPDGTLLEFGLSSAGRIEGPGPNQVYAWLLERERDTCGNTILYQYSEFPGANNQRQKYLRSVSYGPGQPPWNNFHFLTFLYEDRADWFEDCRPGFILRTGKRLKEIIVATQGPTLTNHLAGDFNADGQADFLNRKYILEYADYAGTNSHWSLLAGVTLFGADGLTALPPARFGYTISNPPDNLALANQFIGGLNEPPLVMDSPQVDFLDLNADGLPDILRTDPGGSTHWGWLNRGEVNNAIQWQAPVELNSEDGRALLFNLQSTTPTAHLADMDGDGVADLAVTALDGSVFYFKNHSSLAWGPRRDMSTQDVAPPSPFGNTAVRTADLDFDKRIDIIQSISTGNGTDYRIWFNLADQSYSPGIIVPQNNGLSFASPGIHLADMNGDRIPDLVAIFPSLNKVSSGLGYGRFADPIDVQIPDTLLDESMIAKMSLTDLNGDGLSDLVLERAAPGQLWYWINLGNFTLSRRKTITGMPTAIGASAVIRWADLNGNGTTDIVYADSSSEPRLQAVDIGMHLNSGPQPNLLIAISNGIGRVSQIGYASSTAFAIADALGGKPWPDPMPNPVTVVSSITNLDSLGHNYVTLWRYHNGYYDPEEKQFRGFAEAEQIEVGDPSAPTLVTRSRFDTGRVHEALKGKLLGLSLEQDDGSVFSTETNFWTSPPVTLYTGTNGTNVVFAHPTGSVKLIAELGQGIPRRLETALGFDLFGNQTTNAAYGIVEGGSRAAFNDERITRTEFAVNEDDWLIRLPKLEETTTSDGEVISRIQYFYDDESFSGNNTEIQKGNRTLTRAWIAPANPEAFITLERCRYDSFGNRTLILDPLGSLLNGAPNLAAGHAREIEYDARFHTHPVRETVHVGNGKPTLAFSVDYDQGFATPTTSTDFNNHLTLYRHDAFGRLTAVVKPGDTTQFPTTEYDYVLAHSLGGTGIVNYIETRQLDRSPDSGGGPKQLFYYLSRQFVDGLGRELLSKHEAEPATPGGPPRAIISGATLFNSRQGPATQVNPCFSLLSGAGLDQVLGFEDISRPGWRGLFGQGDNLAVLDLAGCHKTGSRYDALLRPLFSTNQDGTFERTVYEPLITRSYDANQTAATPHAGAGLAHHHDGLGRLVRVDEIVKINDDGTASSTTNLWTTIYVYDVNDRLVRITDSQNNRKDISYDGLLRKTFMNDPDRGTMSYTYDNASNLKETVDARGQQILYTYDGANRLLTETYVASALSPRLGEDRGEGPVNVAYHYDTPSGMVDQGDGTQGVAQNAKGMLAFVSDGSGEEHVSYDARGRISFVVKRIPDPELLESNLPPASVLVAYRTAFEYDSLDRLTRLVYPDSDEVHYQYNERTLLSRIVGGPSGSILSNLVYWPSDQQREMTYGNGVRTTHAYDDRLRLEKLVTAPAQSPNAPLISFRYTFDPGSNIRAIADERPESLIPPADPRRNNQEFDYDDVYRLIATRYSFAAPGGPARNDGQIHYRYDRIGNLRSQLSNIEHYESGLSVTQLGDVSYGGAAGASGRTGRPPGDPPGPHAMTSVSQTATNTPGPRTFPYDANGNMTLIDGMVCTWDFKDRLVRVEGPSMQAQYTYDYTDRRITKKVISKGLSQAGPAGQ